MKLMQVCAFTCFKAALTSNVTTYFNSLQPPGNIEVEVTIFLHIIKRDS